MALTREGRKREFFWTNFIIIAAAIFLAIYALAQWLR